MKKLRMPTWADKSQTPAWLLAGPAQAKARGESARLGPGGYFRG
ncbi:hypothetical protein [Hyalangium rubrum]|nr:hypothetical protein [Hyalangium sp. s54d21]